MIAVRRAVVALICQGAAVVLVILFAVAYYPAQLIHWIRRRIGK